MENLWNLIKGLDDKIQCDLCGYLTQWVEGILNGKTLDATDGLNVVSALNDVTAAHVQLMAIPLPRLDALCILRSVNRYRVTLGIAKRWIEDIQTSLWVNILRRRYENRALEFQRFWAEGQREGGGD
jgi:hypothetical protein